MKKTLDPPKANPEDLNNYRTVTILYLFKGYNKKFIKQRIGKSISNYKSHYLNNHKSVNIDAILKGNELLNNNISFRAITTPSFKKLLQYLNYEVPPLYSKIAINQKAYLGITI
ncbi:hypothetical protein BGZ57DRAFT_851498 [Hyaloscypha finlandica]|nr:hypothetical protein BGZ57DRAFT_851498 [Hyaloscypha finlandica]